MTSACCCCFEMQRRGFLLGRTLLSIHGSDSSSSGKRSWVHRIYLTRSRMCPLNQPLMSLSLQMFHHQCIPQCQHLTSLKKLGFSHAISYTWVMHESGFAFSLCYRAGSHVQLNTVQAVSTQEQALCESVPLLICLDELWYLQIRHWTLQVDNCRRVQLNHVYLWISRMLFGMCVPQKDCLYASSSVSGATFRGLCFLVCACAGCLVTSAPVAREAN